MAKFNIIPSKKMEFAKNTQANSSDSKQDEKDKNEKKSTVEAPRVLTRETYDAVKSVETLARYDDFSYLRINANAYSQTANEGYGIPFKGAVHKQSNKQRILPNQEEAAQMFLADLRGFGLLADCVGSGKTYEACVVISELAVRGIVENLLIIVPHPLLNKWKSVLEEEFGFGRGKLQIIDDLGSIVESTKTSKGYRKPTGAYLMDYEGFDRSTETEIKSMLFDLIVVDEAHNLCDPSDHGNDSMYRLSLMMQTKKEEDKPFCLLLTATPHTGNLANMFNLWYFIRRKGGIPECFKKGGGPTEEAKAEYQKEKNYYTDTVCKGATTVAEYVARAECEFLEGMHEEGNEIRDRFLSEFKVPGRTEPFPKLTYAKYKELKDCEKKSRARAFLSLKENEDIAAYVIDAINRFYTNTVMRSIMVRRRNSFAMKRYAFSYFFLPIEKKVPITPGCEKNRNPILRVDGVPYYDYNEIADFFSDDNRETRLALFEGNVHFRKNDNARVSGFSDYYRELLMNLAMKDPQRDYVRMFQVECSETNAENAILQAKCDRLIELLREIRANKEKKSHRVIIFFDYKENSFVVMNGGRPVWEKVIEYIKENAPDLAKDVVEGKFSGGAADRSSVNVENNPALKAYSENENSILFAEDQLFTEGLDLQSGNVVINFEVPIDPLTVDQRIGRVYRMGQAEENVEVYSFADMTSLDGYCLAYFARIGILSDVDGDATILSGCNSDNMLVLRCPTCKDVSMMPESDYEENLPICCGQKMVPGEVKDENGIVEECFICKVNKLHRSKIPPNDLIRCEVCPERSRREIVVINEFVCEFDPTHRLRRNKQNGFDYRCMAIGQNRMYRREAEGNIIVECRKLCAVKNCPRKPNGCLINEQTDDENAYRICINCPQSDTCKCNMTIPVGESCVSCENITPRTRFACGMQPYSIDFGPDYNSGYCPICKDQKLLQVKQNSFETFIRSRFEHDSFFADHFRDTTKNTLKIKSILKFNSEQSNRG